ncbi:transcription elongation GreA/GreB family factor [Pseudomonas nitritireducens]|uniref:Transcription elongation GreA/GreB family factor n=1 Tax=Pseudomonas nitroreducens TaxID=46680 RepID=A0A7W7P0Y2_PSENT|nr:transcription elongation factor GreAB [Pseudomonas nitritireducens]MBB4863931.1 transcription elongation GreA/GreB family factor [Pseudomonas nitritireducens]
MDKQRAHQLILSRLAEDLEVAVRAARTAHETATHEENVAENKYDTLGLEAAYLAAGQSRRVEEIRQALTLFENLQLRDFDEEQGIQTSALVQLVNDQGLQRWVFLGPDGAGLKVRYDDIEILVITRRAPLGGALLQRQPGDEVEVGNGSARQRYEILAVY